jgi:cobalt-zinc-cadmium efflux system protein
MAHDHKHDRGDPHGSKTGRAFAVSVALNVIIVIVEVVYGLRAHSMALVSDAGHNLTDVFGLVLAWVALGLAGSAPSKRRTYGLRKVSILAAVSNAVVLLVATGGIGWESIRRLQDPGPVEGKTVMVVAGVAVVINGMSAMLFFSERHGDLNVRGAFLHLAGDAAIALGVLVSGGVVLATGWLIVDPIVSLMVSAVVLGSTWSLLRKSLGLIVDAVPEGINPDEVRQFLASQLHVLEVHDLHIWAMSTTETALTAHLIMPRSTCESRFLGDLCVELRTRFKIDHATLQVEDEEAPDGCKLAPEEHV